MSPLPLAKWLQSTLQGTFTNCMRPIGLSSNNTEVSQTGPRKQISKMVQFKYLRNKTAIIRVLHPSPENSRRPNARVNPLNNGVHTASYIQDPCSVQTGHQYLISTFNMFSSSLRSFLRPRALFVPRLTAPSVRVVIPQIRLYPAHHEETFEEFTTRYVPFSHQHYPDTATDKRLFTILVLT